MIYFSVAINFADEAVLNAITRRLRALEKSPKNVEYTLKYMLREFGARLYKPQRLVSISYEEEERRALRGWYRFDWMLNLACFRPLNELSLRVKNAEEFRAHVKDLCIFMSDQIPMWLKLKPGHQVYASFEVRSEGAKFEKHLGSLTGGGGQGSEAMLREDDAAHDIADGMTQLRGENAKDQDKFRITVEREQAS